MSTTVIVKGQDEDTWCNGFQMGCLMKEAAMGTYMDLTDIGFMANSEQSALLKDAEFWDQCVTIAIGELYAQTGHIVESYAVMEMLCDNLENILAHAMESKREGMRWTWAHIPEMVSAWPREE